MDYIDRLFGRVRIDEPVLLDLLQTSAVRRLHGVLQHGITGLIGVTRATTRYEHSLGVMTLVRLMGASLEEQIAALLHDVSHTAFSHVIDYVFDGHDSQSYHEDMKETYMANSDLPDVLAKHGYDWRDFLQEEHYPLLEQPSPTLCADRLDYFLRDSLDLALASRAEVDNALAHLVNYQGRIVANDLDAARWMGYTFINADEASWANFREVGLYELTARAIRTALHLGVLEEPDFWSIDKDLWAKLHASPNPDLHAQLRLISPETQFVWDEVMPDFRVSTKLRTVDPEVLLENEVRSLSELDLEFAHYRLNYLSSKAGKWPMRVVK